MRRLIHAARRVGHGILELVDWLQSDTDDRDAPVYPTRSSSPVMSATCANCGAHIARWSADQESTIGQLFMSPEEAHELMAAHECTLYDRINHAVAGDVLEAHARDARGGRL